MLLLSFYRDAKPLLVALTAKNIFSGLQCYLFKNVFLVDREGVKNILLPAAIDQ